MDDSNNKTTHKSATHRHRGQIILSLGVFVLGVALAFGTSQFPASTGYAKVGPRLMPTIVAGALIVLSLMLLKEAFLAASKVLMKLKPPPHRPTGARFCGSRRALFWTAS